MGRIGGYESVNRYGQPTRRCDACIDRPQCVRCRKRSLYNLNLLREYGITIEQYDEMCESQSDLCAICGQAETMTHKGVIRGLSVDHDHRTKKVRGLLCAGCNVAIGHLQHDENLLLKAIDYLRKTSDGVV